MAKHNSKASFGEVVKSSQYGLSIPSSEGGAIPILGMSNVRDGVIVSEGARGVDLSEKDLKAFRIRKGDFLFNRTNSEALVGKAAIAKDDMDCVFASYLVRFKLDESRVRPGFIGNVFITETARHFLRTLATPGVSQFNINPNTLKKHFKFHLPTLPEQDAILRVLDCWDRGIEEAERLLVLKERRKRALMQQLLTGKRRFPEFVEPWRKCRLGDAFWERNESGFLELRLLSITADRGIIDRTHIERKDTSNADKARYKRIVPGDIGYNTMRMWQGVSALSSLEGIVSPAYTVVTPGPDIDAEFASYLFKSPFMIHLFYRYSQGLVDDTRNLKFNQFKRVPVALPELEEQRRIAAVLNTCDAEITQLRTQIAALKQQKRALMQKLLTGQVRVPEAKNGKVE